MGYEVHDANGFLDPGPTITGRGQLQRLLDAQDAARFPALDELLTHGETSQLKRLGTDARALLKKTADPNIRLTLEALARSAAKAKKLVALMS